MERNIGDQLNKAFEAYRQVSIEKDNAKKELQKMTEYYEQYTQELQKQIEDQQRLISELEAKLSATKQPSGEMTCEPCNHLLDGASTYRKIQYPENMGTVAVAPNLPVNSSVDYQEMLEAFEGIQGKFRKIHSLTRRQKDHLKRFHRGTDTANDQRFSMPIQCTDRTAEAEGPFPAALSAPQGNVGLAVPANRPPSPTLTEEESEELPMPFVYPSSPSHSTSSSPSQESVRGPQQSLWSPRLSDAVDVRQEPETPPSSSPDKCAFCHAEVPQDRMNSHLYSHFSPKNEVDD
ncbi:TRAF family member-associated NF-kappa-B activator isoform X2 [Cololabis saira]|uniref:TRAF family member-associated NF-kappa-B activator isoform X2 n=1 Tax=Cololabis saira TaxID=129043 RepID=UPI002AD2FAAB|nr:TRAF family member-associated NF-kappa-B activator isoform X2 [Cololabis saira]